MNQTDLKLQCQQLIYFWRIFIMNQIKVSVVMPVYNVEEFLGETLGYVTKQTLKEIEIICVDDGSSDGSLALLREIAEQDQRIKVISQDNAGAGAARNRGMDQATGDYIIFWDSDDIFNEAALERMYDKIRETDSDLCLCASNQYDMIKERFYETEACIRHEFISETVPFNKYDLPDTIFNITNNVPWNKLFKRSFIDKHGLRFQEIRQANDTYFSMMSLFLADRITYIDEVLVSYRVSNSLSISGKASSTTLCGYDSYVYTMEKLETYEDFPLVKKSFQNRCISGLYHSLNIQTSFDSYVLLYNKIKDEGIDHFGFRDMAEEDFVLAWYYKDLEMIKENSAGDFLIYKSTSRRIGGERNKNRIKRLRTAYLNGKETISKQKETIKEKNQTIKDLRAEKRELNRALTKACNRVIELETSFSYKLGRALTVPVRVVRDWGKEDPANQASASQAVDDQKQTNETAAVNQDQDKETAIVNQDQDKETASPKQD